jgi:excisionase family DNA binding protein
MASDRDVPQPEQLEIRLLLTVTEAAHALNLGRSLVYELVTTREIASIKIGRARRIPVPALHEFISHQLADQGPGDHIAQTEKNPGRSTARLAGADATLPRLMKAATEERRISTDARSAARHARKPRST